MDGLLSPVWWACRRPVEAEKSLLARFPAFEAHYTQGKPA